MIDTVDMNRAFDALRDTVVQSFERIGEAMVNDMRQMISVDVQRLSDGTVIRSVTPEAPRRDSGALWESISKAVEVGLYGVEMVVFTDKPYSAKLQSPSYITGPRLHWSRLAQDWQDPVPQFLFTDLQARLQ